jgi:hypothetical protein
VGISITIVGGTMLSNRGLVADQVPSAAEMYFAVVDENPSLFALDALIF